MSYTIEVVNIGANPNDGQGDPLRTAFTKINNNFAFLSSTGFNTLETLTNGLLQQPIFATSVDTFTQATFQINSINPLTSDSQNIVINASIQNNLLDVKWTGHSTIFFGTPVTTYDMAVVDNYVILYANPLVDAQLSHFIAYQVTWNEVIPGLDLELENGDGVLVTENEEFLTTEQA
jgi:hypothetical protein